MLTCHCLSSSFDAIIPYDGLSPPPGVGSPLPIRSTGSNQAVSPSQLSLASCLSPDGTLDVDKYRRYTAYRLAKARGRSEAILSTMFVAGGESHVASVEQQGNPTIVKSRRSRVC